MNTFNWEITNTGLIMKVYKDTESESTYTIVFSPIFDQLPPYEIMLSSKVLSNRHKLKKDVETNKFKSRKK